MSSNHDLYQQLIIDHSKSPRNYGKLEGATHWAEGYNPLCGDHLWVYLKVDSDGTVQAISFEGSGCAISKASASLMTMELKGKSVENVRHIFQQFHDLLLGQPSTGSPALPPKLGIFSNIWQYPSRVKCAALSWHAMNGALNCSAKISTE
jgi:nitrogen fixation NifU-like protein